MKQVIQNMRSGELELLDVPCPRAARGHLLIRTRASLISAGTERSLVEFGKASLLAKAYQSPDRVRQVLEKVRSDGLLPTLEAVFNKLDDPFPLGYCNAGEVVEVGEDVTGFAVGDRVASNGPHAELVHVPVNLCAKIPDGVADDHAAFAVLGAIALQGIRLLGPQLGETVVVFGLGLVGILTVQLLAAAGVRVLGIDLDPRRLELAQSFGAVPVDLAAGTDPVAAAGALTEGRGVDGVLITASAKNDQIVSQSAKMSRKRGRIVLVGVVDLELNRSEFYEKELTFQVSCSYGPGRYDPAYEQQGIDYPYPFVRWTEQRNIAAILDLLATGRLDVAPLVTSRVPHGEAARAYDMISRDRGQLGVVLTYPDEVPALDRVIVRAASAALPAEAQVTAGIIGAGQFTKGTLLPALKKSGAALAAIASSGGMSAAHAARKFGIRASSSDYRAILNDPAINTVFITTRHHQHAPMVVEALAAGKHVFVEKPLAIDEAGLEQVRQQFEKSSDRHLMVGFNRRFAPLIAKTRQLLAGRTRPLCLTMTVNAGYVPANHWTHEPRVGGGRIIGEGCHWIDLLSFLAGAPVTEVGALTVGDVPGAEQRIDQTSISLALADGSIGTVHYFSGGHRSFPKEKLEIFGDGKVLVLDNFRSLTGYGWSSFGRQKLFAQDKGHTEELRQFVQRVAAGGGPLISFDQIDNVTRASFAASAAAAAGRLSVQPLK